MIITCNNTMMSQHGRNLYCQHHLYSTSPATFDDHIHAWMRHLGSYVLISMKQTSDDCLTSWSTHAFLIIRISKSWSCIARSWLYFILGGMHSVGLNRPWSWQYTTCKIKRSVASNSSSAIMYTCIGCRIGFRKPVQIPSEQCKPRDSEVIRHNDSSYWIQTLP